LLQFTPKCPSGAQVSPSILRCTSIKQLFSLGLSQAKLSTYRLDLDYGSSDIVTKCCKIVWSRRSSNLIRKLLGSQLVFLKVLHKASTAMKKEWNVTASFRQEPKRVCRKYRTFSRTQEVKQCLISLVPPKDSG